MAKSPKSTKGGGVSRLFGHCSNYISKLLPINITRILALTYFNFIFIQISMMPFNYSPAGRWELRGSWRFRDFEGAKGSLRGTWKSAQCCRREDSKTKGRGKILKYNHWDSQLEQYVARECQLDKDHAFLDKITQELLIDTLIIHNSCLYVLFKATLRI